IATIVNTSIDRYFPPESNVEVIAEPGRFYVVSAFSLTTNVIGKRKDITDDKVFITYYVNDGLFGSFANTRFGDEIVEPIPEIKDISKRKLVNSIIWGQTCEDDCIRTEVVLPEMEIGEWMTFKDMGAYSLVLFTNFNGFQVPMLKCHVSDSATKFLQKLPSCNRLLKVLSF
ncbi:Ornithine decarboxylase-like protein, partial [Leptotrombidium deliense]